MGREIIFSPELLSGVLLAHLWQYTGEQLISAENRHWIAGKDLLGSLVKSYDFLYFFEPQSYNNQFPIDDSTLLA